jgi:uncharacterized protein
VLYLNGKQSKILDHVKTELSKDTGHTLDHIMRVYKNALLIASDDPKVNRDILTTAVLLHDIARVKEDQDNTGKTDHAIVGAEMAEAILKNLNYPPEDIDKIKHCIQTHRYRTSCQPASKEAKILFDADKLDLLGALGIARGYMISGEYHQQLFSSTPLDEYVASNLVGGKPNGRIKDFSKHALNIEFELKIKNIPRSLYTKKARLIAQRRIRFMKCFFDHLQQEIAGAP